MESRSNRNIEQKSSCNYSMKSTITRQQDDKQQYQSSTTTIILIIYIYFIDTIISLLCCKTRTTLIYHHVVSLMIEIWKWSLLSIPYKNHSMSGMPKFFLDVETLCFSYVQSGNLNYFIRSCKYFDCHFCRL